MLESLDPRLHNFIEKYRRVLQKSKHSLTPDDYLLSQQLFILRTQPPRVVEGLYWRGKPYESESKLTCRLADGKKLTVSIELIEQNLHRRLLSERDKRFLLSYSL